MLNDLKFALRVLGLKPAFAFAAVLSIALGIGANSAIFGLIDALSLRPMAVPESSRIVRVFSVTDQNSEGALSYPEYRDLRSHASALKNVVAIGGRGAMLERDGKRTLITLNLVPADFFTALGVKPQIGTVFREQSQSPEVVLGNAFWRRHYGGDPSIVGKQIRIQRATTTPFTVVGVLPPAFRSVDTGDDRDLWFPENAWKRLGDQRELEMPGNRWFRVIARLGPGETVASASAQLHALARRMAAANPQSNEGRELRLISDFDYRLKQAGDNGLAVLAIVLLVVLISSVNVANLLLSRANVRGREMAVRLALGASRSRLMRQLMLESLLLGLLGLGLGILIGWWLIAWMPLLQVQPPGFDLPNDFEFNGRVILFSVAVTLVTSVLFGLVPALRFTRPDLVPALKSEAAQGSARWPLRNWLVAGEVAIAMALLASAGVVVRSFSKTRTTDLGFGRQQVLLVWISPDAANPTLFRTIASRFSTMPGVKDVALAVRAPLSLSSNGMFQRVTFPGRPEYVHLPPFEIKYNSVSPEFLQAMGTAIVRGRGFDRREEIASSDAVIINETMARRFYPGGEDPVGRKIVVGGKPRTIVGVARNAPINAIGEAPESYFYLPFWANFEDEVTFLIRTEGEAAALAPSARGVLKQVDSRIDPLGITTMNELIRYSASRYEMTAELAGALGLLGLVLTAVGLYGVTAYGVSQRSRELGIRMALGAGPRETRMLVLREVTLLGLAGLAAGIPLAMMATRLMESMLFGVSPWDGATFAGAAVLLMAVLMCAGFVPARRATSVEPAVVLRSV